jgi:hypothetical protein
MTEAEWLACTDPIAVLEAGGERATDRKVRLFAVACCRQVAHLAPKPKQEALEAALAFAERFADGRATRGERVKAEKAARASLSSMVSYTLTARCTTGNAFYAARHAREFAGCGWDDEHAAAAAGQAALARDVLGPPAGRAVAVDPRWLTPTTVSLARAIYDDRAFDRLPILADAVQDAGCIDADLLGHLRGPGPHVRGCWAVDLLLGKE